MSTPASKSPLLQVTNLVKHFPVRGGVFNSIQGQVHAVNGVSFAVHHRETVGVVGESGCGKSTLGKLVIRLIEPTSGSVRYNGTEITGLAHNALMPFRRKMQIIFQDPFSSLNPRLTIAGLLKEAIRFHRIVPDREIDAYIDALITKVGLRPDSRSKFPHEFSGGQRQRIGIARALALNPEFIVADEPVSALDVSIQAQVLNLMMELKDQLGLTLLFISHDLKVIEHFCDRVLVMYLGHIVEELPTEDLHQRAQHPYTRALLGANPIDDPDDRRPLTVLRGDVPSPLTPPKGCPFSGRCPLVMDRCRQEMPPLVGDIGAQRVACWAVNPGHEHTTTAPAPDRQADTAQAAAN
jgi:oligopeptide/dipeptide ABC transporter ATP-binding protein